MVPLLWPPPVRAQGDAAKLKIIATTRGAIVRVNGEYIGRLPMRHAATVEAGTLEVEIEAEGYRTYRQTINVAPRTRKRLRIELVPESAAPLAAQQSSYPGEPSVDSQQTADHLGSAGFGIETISIYDLSHSYHAKQATTSTQPATAPVAPPQASKPKLVAPAAESTTIAPTDSISRLLTDSAHGSTGGQAVNKPLLPKKTEAKSAAFTSGPFPPHASVANTEYATEDESSYPQEKEDEGPDNFDPFNVEIFGGYSYIFMVLGHEEVPDAGETQTMSQEEIDRLSNATPADLIDSVQGPGFTTGAAAWLRFNPLWLGTRVGYSTYDPAAILTLMGELGMRFQGSVAEVFFGFGLGSGWLYGVPQERVNADSGLALKFGLGLNFFVARDVTFGAGFDAIGLFLAGKGISPGQIGDFSPETSNHPIGVQLPVTLSLSLRT